MICFKDELSYAQEFRIDSGQHVVEIQHLLDENSDDDVSHDVVITGALLLGTSARAGEIRLVGDSKTPLSDIANMAKVCIYRNDAGKVLTPFEFIRNYKSILLGEYAGWELKEVIVRPNYVNLDYIDEEGNWERIFFGNNPPTLTFEVPHEEAVLDEEEPGAPFRILTQLRRDRDNAAHGITSQLTPKQRHSNTTRVIIRCNPDKKRVEVWTGQIDKGIDNGLQSGQRMLSVEYDEDDDIIVRRHYHERDFSDEFMELALKRNDEQQIFCL